MACAEDGTTKQLHAARVCNSRLDFLSLIFHTAVEDFKDAGAWDGMELQCWRIHQKEDSFCLGSILTWIN